MKERPRATVKEKVMQVEVNLDSFQSGSQGDPSEQVTTELRATG